MVLGQIGGIAHGHLGDGRSRQASSLEGIISGHEDGVAVRPAAVSGEQHIWYECAVCAACNPPSHTRPARAAARKGMLSAHMCMNRGRHRAHLMLPRFARLIKALNSLNWSWFTVLPLARTTAVVCVCAARQRVECGCLPEQR